MKAKRLLRVVLTLVVLCVAFVLWRSFDENKKIERIVERARQESNVAALELWMGSPRSVYDQFPPPLGKDFVSEGEFATGVRLKAYVLRGMPPLFLLVKYHGADGRIIGIKTETS